MIQFDHHEVIRLKSIHDDFTMILQSLRERRLHKNIKIKLNEFPVSVHTAELLYNNKLKFNYSEFIVNDMQIIGIMKNTVVHSHINKYICGHEVVLDTAYDDNNKYFYIEYSIVGILSIIFKCDSISSELIKMSSRSDFIKVIEWLDDRKMSAFVLNEEDIIMMKLELGL